MQETIKQTKCSMPDWLKSQFLGNGEMNVCSGNSDAEKSRYQPMSKKINKRVIV